MAKRKPGVWIVEYRSDNWGWSPYRMMPTRQDARCLVLELEIGYPTSRGYRVRKYVPEVR